MYKEPDECNKIIYAIINCNCTQLSFAVMSVGKQDPSAVHESKRALAESVLRRRHMTLNNLFIDTGMQNQSSPFPLVYKIELCIFTGQRFT